MFRSAGRLPPLAACLTNAVRSFAALAAFRLNGTFRNTTIFEADSANTYTAVRRGGKKAEQPGPCGGCVYPFLRPMLDLYK